MYTVSFNPARKIWMVWKTVGNTCEVVKTFKTEAAARKYVQSKA